MISASERGSVATRWSMITRIGTVDSAAALAELCARFRYPVYAYLRCSGAVPVRAAELASRFLDQVERGPSGEGPPTGRQFRRFLLASLEAFVEREEIRSEHDGVEPDAADPLEGRYARDAARADSPAEAFQRGFAVDVLLRAFARLRDEAEAAGHGAMYAALAPYFARDPEPRDYEALAATLAVRAITLAVALNRLRQRLQELAEVELVDTLSSSAELAGEQAAMRAALGGSP